MIPMPSPSGTNFAGAMLPSGRGFDRCGAVAGTERNPVAAYDEATPHTKNLAEHDPRIQKVLDFLQSRLTTAEWVMARTILLTPTTNPVADPNADPGNSLAEDTRRRFPEMRKIRVEPAYQSQAPKSLPYGFSELYDRFPELRRIKRA